MTSYRAKGTTMPRKRRREDEGEKKGREEPQQPRKVDAIIHIRVFRPLITRVGGIVIKVYEPVDELESMEKVELRTRKDAMDAVYNKLQKDRTATLQRYRNMLVEVDAEGKGFVLSMGESTEPPEGLKPEMLFPRPSRLLRLGVVRDGTIKWTRPRRGAHHYVYEGIVEIPRDADAVVIETERGRRVIKKPSTPA